MGAYTLIIYIYITSGFLFTTPPPKITSHISIKQLKWLNQLSQYPIHFQMSAIYIYNAINQIKHIINF